MEDDGGQEEYLRGYKDVKIFKAQRLGVGSYGSVYKTRCDQLPCAAKIMHPTLLESSPDENGGHHQSMESRKPVNRFQQECQFLSQFRHPNIIQYIGVCWDNSSGLPVLLMELMDQNLTQFLERRVHKPLPFHTAVNISQDIALAVAFLHNNKIWHRDLSSNNILMLGDRRAKVTDFGMAKIFSQTECTKTRLPGTSVYMSPESLDETPEYSDKLDVFSYGVLVIQILCKHFPKPSKKMRSVTGSMYEKVSEVNRRKSHIELITDNHPLLPLALECIADSERDRPNAKEVTERIRPLKSLAQYAASVKSEEEYLERLKELAQRSNSSEGVTSELLTKLREKDTTIAELEHELHQKERKIQQLQTSLNIKQQDFEAELESQASRYTARLEILEGMLRQAQSKTNVTMTTKESARAPRSMYRMSNAIRNGEIIYFAVSGDVYEDAIYSLDLANGGVWSALPPVDELQKWSTNTIEIVCGDLTTIGGSDEDENVTNQLFSFVNRGSAGDQKGADHWDEIWPPMKHKRDNAIAFATGSHLVVAGGMSESDIHLRSVEVLDTKALQWTEAEPLMEPLSSACATVCNGAVYCVGGWASDKTPTSAVHTCNISDLIASSSTSHTQAKPAKIWKKVADLPVLKSTAICYHGHLIAIGGVDVMNRATTVVQRYDEGSDVWIVIGHLMVPRGQPFAMVLSDYAVTLVIGGHKGYYINKIYEVEEVTFHLHH